MRYDFSFVIVVGLFAGAAVAAPSLPGPAFPRFESAAALTSACDAALAEGGRRVKTFEKHAPDSRWLAGWDDLNAWIEDASGPVGLLENVHPDKAMRSAAQACSQRWAEFGSTLGQNETLYRALTSVKPRDPIEREFVKFAREGFEDSGVSLAPADRASAKQLNDRIADLSRQFEARIRDANVKVPVAVGDLAGVPEDVWAKKPRDDAGKVLLGLDNPTLVPVLERAVRDVDELRDAKARHLGTPLATTKIERWDVGFYTERLRRERYSVDQEAFRPYFPPAESLAFVMRTAERILGIRYTPVRATLWHDA